VTRDAVLPDFGGLDAGDSLCQAAADDAGLTGSYRAWLSDSTTTGASGRLSHGAATFVMNTDDAGIVVVAQGWASLTSGMLHHAIDHDQGGQLHSAGAYAWTGTFAFGGLSAWAVGGTCGDWTVATNCSHGGVGAIDVTDSGAWSYAQWLCCNQAFPLYCLQEPSP
jgi:hypothetical protein